jgi:hypothetical protein
MAYNKYRSDNEAQSQSQGPQLSGAALHKQTAVDGGGRFPLTKNPEISDVIGWTTGGESFNIKQVGKFTEEILPRYFKHRNFSSFIRQLNMYGFRKTRHPDGDNVYMHEHFRAGHKQLLRHINRRMREQREDRIVLQGAGGGG